MHANAPQPIRVEAYAGGRGDELPRAFECGARRVRVHAILERWREPEGRSFLVEGEDGTRHLLRHLESDSSWWLVRTDCA